MVIARLSCFPFVWRPASLARNSASACSRTNPCGHARARAHRGRSRMGQALSHVALERDDGRGAKKRVATTCGPLWRRTRLVGRASVDADKSGRATREAAKVSVAAGAPGSAKERNVDPRAPHDRLAGSMDRDCVRARDERRDRGGQPDPGHSTRRTESSGHRPGRRRDVGHRRWHEVDGRLQRGGAAWHGRASAAAGDRGSGTTTHQLTPRVRREEIAR